jgi:hypothetical protein
MPGRAHTLDNPRATFDGYTPDTTWSLAQTAYFRSYATWHYLVPSGIIMARPDPYVPA